MDITAEYADYKEVSGILVAHKLSQSFGPQVIEFVAKSVTINSKIKSSEFKIE